MQGNVGNLSVTVSHPSLTPRTRAVIIRKKIIKKKNEEKNTQKKVQTTKFG